MFQFITGTLSVTIAPPSATLDVGQSQTFTATVAGGTSSLSYQWYLNGQAVGTGASYSFSTQSVGSYSINATVTDSGSNPYTVTSIIAIIIVNGAPSTVAISPTSATLDHGQSQLFTSSVSGGTTPYSYQWYLNGAAVLGATSPTWTFRPSSSGSYTVYVNVTDSVGFKVTSNVVTVTVNPSLFASISPASAAMIVGQSQLFNSTTSGGTSPFSYQWYLNNTLVSGATSTSWTFTPNSTGVYLIYMKVNDSVSVQATSNTATVTIKIGIHDVAVTNVTSSKTVVVEGNSASVNVTVRNEGNYTETFNVTLYGELLWGWENDTFPLYVFTGVTLTPGSTVTLTVSITLPAFLWGICLLKAIAGPVPGQTRVSDLVCTGGYIRVFSPKIRVRGLFYSRCGWFGFMPL